MRLPAAVLLILSLTGGAVAAESSYRVSHRPGEGEAPGVVAVEGIDADNLAALGKSDWKAERWQELLAVKLRKGDADEIKKRPALLGSYRTGKGTLEFVPRFPLEPGLSYAVTFDPSRLPLPTRAPALNATVGVPARKPGPAPVVERVYPSADMLPENQLKFYLHFSAPMAQGRVYRFIKLLDAKGKEIETPFLTLDEELWNFEGTRFTLFIDPGRIKQGLRPREDLGPVLEAGRKYTLVIDSAWTDARGTPLKETFRKEFRVGQPVEACPAIGKWKIQAPAADTSAPLEVTLPAALDSGMLVRVVWVMDAKGDRVPGKVALDKNETLWKFTPEKPWAKGDYRLVADTRLEDLAGNSLARPFEVDVERPLEKEITAKLVERAFTVK